MTYKKTTAVVWGIYHTASKAFITSSGYYGNENNVRGFTSKEGADKYIETYYRYQGYVAKQMKVITNDGY